MNDYGPAILAMTQGIGVFNTLLPPLADIRRADEFSEIAQDVRMGELAACTITLAIGVLVSVLTKRTVPIIISAIICAVMLAVYETTLKV